MDIAPEHLEFVVTFENVTHWEHSFNFLGRQDFVLSPDGSWAVEYGPKLELGRLA